MAKTNQRRFITYCFRCWYLSDAKKKYSNDELELLPVVGGLERFRFYSYGKKSPAILWSPGLGTTTEKKNAHKQYSDRLTQWLDRLNHFDVTLYYTAGKEIKYTDIISRNPTENAELEENYEE